MEEFYNIFGPELKAVTGDPKRIDEVLRRVDGLVSPMEVLTFEPFNIRCATQWKIVMEEFKMEVLVRSRSFDLYFSSFSLELLVSLLEPLNNKNLTYKPLQSFYEVICEKAVCI